MTKKQPAEKRGIKRVMVPMNAKTHQTLSAMAKANFRAVGAQIAFMIEPMLTDAASTK